MKAIVVEKKGTEGDLCFKEVPAPEIRSDEILVRVKAFALNRADILQRKGQYPPPAGESEILGLELAGETVRVGEASEKFKVGDRVFGLVGGGAYAEYCVMKSALAIPLPSNLSYSVAAAIPEAFFTANETLFVHGGLKSGEHVLIHAGGSGVGTTAIQMAKLEGATVYATAGDETKCQNLIKLGADFAYNYQSQDFNQEIAPSLNEKIDLIHDVIGAKYLASHLSILREKGRLILVAMMGGRSGNLDLSQVLSKRIKIQGFVLRRQSVSEKSQIAERFKQKWLPLILKDKIKPVIDKQFNWTEISQAHAYLESRRTFGKIVVNIP